jgi:hypothetical protein
MNLLKAAMHPINFYMSWRLSGGFILGIANTFSVLGSIPRQETTYPSNFLEGTPIVHFLGFSFILHFLRLSKVQVRYESLIFPSLYDHVVNIRFSVAPKL